LIRIEEVSALPYRDAKEVRKDEKEEAVIQYLPLVKKIASQFSMALPAALEENDLIGCGIVGLLEAWEKYDPSRGIKFSAFASRRIKGAMIDELRKMAWAPRSFFSRLRQVQEAEEKTGHELQRSPTTEEIAGELNWSGEQVEEVWRQCNFYSLLSLETVLFGEDQDAGMKLEEVISSGEDPGAVLQEKEKIDLLARALEKLPERDRVILALHYQEELTQKEIAEVLEVSNVRVSQLHARALQKLKKILTAQVEQNEG